MGHIEAALIYLTLQWNQDNGGPWEGARASHFKMQFIETLKQLTITVGLVNILSSHKYIWFLTFYDLKSG